jgi:hypothetical protein
MQDLRSRRSGGDQHAGDAQRGIRPAVTHHDEKQAEFRHTLRHPLCRAGSNVRGKLP